MTDLDRYFPPAGPCALCGGPDKRHRLGDALYGYWRAGESVAWIAKEWELKHRAVVALLVAYELARRGHKRRPFSKPLEQTA